MKTNSTGIMLLIIFVAIGMFPGPAHQLVDFAAGIVGAVGRLLQGQGLSISGNTIEMIVVLGLIIVTISAVSTAVVDTGKLIKGRRK